VADANVTESVNPLRRQEQNLRNAVEQYLNTPRGKSNRQIGAFGACADLGLFYLDNDRTGDADKLFRRLDQGTGRPDFRKLGQLGKGIILALRDMPNESNQEFRKVFGGGKKKKQASLKDLPGPIVELLRKPRWRYWINRARWYNAENGLPNDKVPRVLQLVPLRENPKK
jgi:hypothetical protein